MINWSCSSDQVRLKVPIGIDYGAGVPAQELRRQRRRTRAALLIHDPMNGVSEVKSGVLLHIRDRFHANQIAFPFPQQDLHFKTPLKVRMGRAAPAPARDGGTATASATRTESCIEGG